MASELAALLNGAALVAQVVCLVLLLKVLVLLGRQRPGCREAISALRWICWSLVGFFGWYAVARGFGWQRLMFGYGVVPHIAVALALGIAQARLSRNSQQCVR